MMNSTTTRTSPTSSFDLDKKEVIRVQLGMPLEEVEKQYIKMTLSMVNGNKRKAATILHISRRALYNKLKRFGML
jgi:DNA-binding NtrC family response regulator